ncbi:ATP-binding protein [Magnetospirillum sp. UT-4]|uniref:hybrid sensor histidine kinase/response regulator n=1 Tax=Magnetospirillum sp. UT-4 TaxID=2681467 RepID=UPI0013837949|nr:ATP-binding protein [Magnetospirillum sp. UT-4]CAA7615206.1 Signal transduction histidine kinase [Magnetospirillum sp. UT-4]
MATAPGKANVLVVDDEPQILTAITDLLEDEFAVWTASDAESALRMLRVQDMAVILSDQRMPGMTGSELLGQAREMSDATRVLVTGYSDLDALVKAVNLGQIHAYLSKPWNPLELKVVVRTAADRWRLGRSLESERRLLRALMDHSPDAIFFKDRELRFSRISPVQAAVLGVTSPDEVIGRTLSELVHDGRAGAVEEQERDIIDRGVGTIDKLESVVGADGATSWYSVSKVPVRDDDEVSGLIGIARDVTKRKQAEDFLRRAHEELQKAVEERTAWLRDEIRRRAMAEEQARSARDVAEAASRAKTVFLANMSHELRTPLNAIIGFSELAETLMNEAELAKYGSYLGNITESAHHLLRVISDILDVSRIEVGKVTLRETEIDVGEVIQSAMRLAGHVAGVKGQTLAFRIADNFPRLRADERLVKQVLLNIVANATKFTPEGGHISVGALLREDGAVMITIEDDGVGIAADDIPVVLQPFGQVENTMAPKHEGTGLGLPLAKGFMELHGGALAVHSAVGEGTRVTLVFPPERTVALAVTR